MAWWWMHCSVRRVACVCGRVSAPSLAWQQNKRTLLGTSAWVERITANSASKRIELCICVVLRAKPSSREANRNTSACQGKTVTVCSCVRECVCGGVFHLLPKFRKSTLLSSPTKQTLTHRIFRHTVAAHERAQDVAKQTLTVPCHQHLDLRFTFMADC